MKKYFSWMVDSYTITSVVIASIILGIRWIIPLTPEIKHEVVFVHLPVVFPPEIKHVYVTTPPVQCIPTNDNTIKQLRDKVSVLEAENYVLKKTN